MKRLEMELDLPIIQRWIDFTTKYGVGYRLSNGNIGVLFNDGSSMLADSQMKALTYLSNHSHECNHYSVAAYPQSLEKKVQILKQFNVYMDKITSETAELPHYMRTRALCAVKEKPTFLTNFKLEDKVVIFVLSDG